MLKHVIFFITASFFLYFLAAPFCTKQTDGFTFAKVNVQKAYNPQWELREMSDLEREDLKRALDETYSYYGRGGQSYIFFSENGEFVFKLIKQKPFTYPFWMKYLPPIPYKTKKITAKKEKLKRDYLSYVTSFNELKELTGTVFVHFNRSSDLNKTLLLKDKIGVKHLVDLDTIDFVIQKKAEKVPDRIAKQMEKDDIDGAKKSLSLLVAMMVERAKLGFHDRDPNIETNCGFLEDKAIKIDIGRLVKNDTIQLRNNYQKEIYKVGMRFHGWLEPRYPELAAHFMDEIEKVN